MKELLVLYGFHRTIFEIELDANIELSPSSKLHFERRLCDILYGLGVRGIHGEFYTRNVVRNVLTADSTHVNAPLVSVDRGIVSCCLAFPAA
jgi:hypothetical protein